jgi:hypothetical protein
MAILACSFLAQEAPRAADRCEGLFMTRSESLDELAESAARARRRNLKKALGERPPIESIRHSPRLDELRHLAKELTQTLEARENFINRIANRFFHERRARQLGDVRRLQEKIATLLEQELTEQGFLVTRNDSPDIGIVIERAPEGSQLDKVITGLHKNYRAKVAIGVATSFFTYAKASYLTNDKTIRLNWTFVFTSPDRIYATLLHEIRHAKLHADRLKKITTPYASYFISDARDPRFVFGSYPGFMLFEELSTNEKSLRHLARNIPSHPDDAENPSVRFEIRRKKLESFATTFLEIIAEARAKTRADRENRDVENIEFFWDKLDDVMTAKIPVAEEQWFNVALLTANPETPREELLRLTEEYLSLARITAENHRLQAQKMRAFRNHPIASPK